MTAAYENTMFPKVLDTGGKAVLTCQYKEGNLNDFVYAVAVKTNLDIIVQYILKKFLAVCSSFLHRSDMIVCKVTGSRQKPAVLPQVFCTFNNSLL